LPVRLLTSQQLKKCKDAGSIASIRIVTKVDSAASFASFTGGAKRLQIGDMIGTALCHRKNMIHLQRLFPPTAETAICIAGAEHLPLHGKKRDIFDIYLHDSPAQLHPTT
jgi:hypothetical protein